MNLRVLKTLFAIASVFAIAAHAQDVASITKQIERLNSSIDTNDETRNKADAILTDAKALLATTAQREESTAAYTATAASAPATLQRLRDEYEEIANLPAAELPENLSDNMVKTRLIEITVEKNQLEATIEALSSRDDALRARKEEIANEIQQASKELGELQSAPPAATNAADPVAEANAILHGARLAERRATLDDLSTERSTLPARQDLTAARLKLARMQLARQIDEIRTYETRLSQSRTIKAKTRLESAEQNKAALMNAPVGLQTLARQNIELAQSGLELAQKRASLINTTHELKQELARIASSAQTVDQVLATGQLNDQTAKLLRNVRTRLPNTGKLSASMQSADQALVALRLNQVLWQDRLRNLSATADTAKKLLGEVGVENPSAETLASTQVLIDQRTELLQAMIDEARVKSVEISDQRQVRQDILQRVRDLTQLLDRRLLWLPTKEAGTQGLGKILADNAKWLLSLEDWNAVVFGIVAGYASLAFVPLLLALLALALWRARKVIRHRIIKLGQKVGNVDTDTYLTTPEALLLTVLYALPLPLAFTSFGLAAATGQPSDFVLAVSQGLFAMSSVLFILIFFRSLACKEGVFHRHFGWSEPSRMMLRRHLFWFMVIESSAAFIFTTVIISGDITIKYGIGRVVFMISSVAIAMFAYYLLRPNNGVVSFIDEQKEDAAILKIVFILLVTTPLIIGLLPITGYYEAAIELQSRLFQSGIVIMLAGVIYRLSLRLLLVGQRRVERRKQLKHLEREQANREAVTETQQTGDATPTFVSDVDADLSNLSDQSRSALLAISTVILALGLWATWRSLIPAFSAADDIILWHSVSQLDGVSVSTGTSLWDIMIALILIAIGLVLARNINGILELVVFERFTLDSGTRYAVSTIAKYVLISIIVVAGLSRLGLDWSSLQWVIAALGVGLGFGLQEIVANFVSGLIILFERPVRVGDIVTIGNLEGTVTSIQIRATRITDFDNREVLLPNKSIITDNVTNWTLNDQVTRIIIRIGVAYGSDIDQVRAILLEQVSSHPDTLTTPGPVVFFMSHGDSSLDFEARVFVATPSKRLPVTHDLNRALNYALKEHGIEIPFPQRDIHIKNSEPAAPVAG